jgi:hypothetical protein
MKELSQQEMLIVSGGDLASWIDTNWSDDWVVRYDAGGPWLDTGNACVPLNPTYAESSEWSQAFVTLVDNIREGVANYVRENCAVNATTSPPFLEIECRLLGK